MHGQAMVEFALAVPFLVLILIASLYFGLYFLTAQITLHAAQVAAQAAAVTPNLSDQATRDNFRGFTTSGSLTNTNSIIFSSLAAANMLSQGTTGNMPNGSVVHVLPWDSDGTATDAIPPGTVAVRIDYPFKFLGGPFGTGAMDTVAVTAPDYDTKGMPFYNFVVTQKAVAAQTVYQN
jgi:Flp pilus assembly protein TadG